MMNFLQNLNPSQEIIIWLLYEVVLPLLPVGLVWFVGYLIANRKTLFSIIRDGQLCFYCTTTAASLIKDLVAKPVKQAPINGLVTFLIILIIFDTFVYGAAVVTQTNAQNTKTFGWTSLFMCFLTICLVVFVRNK